MRAIALVLLASLAACDTGTSRLRELPATAVARNIPGPDHPKLLKAEGLNWSELPPMIPVGVIDAATTNSGWESHARWVWRKAVESKVNADVVVIEDGGTAVAGSVQQYWGMGIATSSPVYARTLHGLMFKLAPCRLGIHWKEDGMVVAVDEDDSVKEAGIQEGDTLLSVGGKAISTGKDRMSCPVVASFLTKRPGEEVKMVWIRPGKGRMEGVVKLAPPNQETRERLATMRDALMWAEPSKPSDNN